MSPEILNPKFSRELWIQKRLNPESFLPYPDIFQPAIFRVCGRTKMADLIVTVVVTLMATDGGRWLPHSVTGSATSFIMGNAISTQTMLTSSNLSEMTIARIENLDGSG